LIGPHQLAASASVGASLYPNDGEDAETLLKHADAAMYRAKQQGRNSLEFHSRPASMGLTGRGALALRLRQAIEKQQFVLHYQPTIDPHGQVVSLEALVRWRHPDWGLIYPLQFIPVAEETGLILDIGEWVLRSACFDRRAWQDGAPQPPKVSVNLSTRQLYQGKFLVESLSRTLAEFSLNAACLEIEVTEKTLAHDETVAIQTLRDVNDMGVGISLDDFGTGHSSLARLQQFPIRGVKIDRSFIHRLPASADDTTLVNAMIGMGHGFNLSVLAEGVENGEQMNFLVSHGIDLLQGYYIGKPMPAEACNSLLASPKLKPT
jgi:EAL domain-containing protein (putative c-di-GMP-specific phosphodiesterase class I)